MKPIILFAEQKSYYMDLGVLKHLNMNKYDFEFDGARKYKTSPYNLKKYSLIVSTLYTNPLSNFLIIKAKENNVKTFLISDGIIDWSNMFNNPLQLKYGLNLYHPIIHDMFLCVGDEESSYFNFMGVPSINYIPARIINSYKSIPLPKTKKILITTANTAYFNETEKRMLINLLIGIKKETSKLNIDVIYRIFDECIIEELNIQENNMIDEDFDTILETVDTVITTPSSISLNSMYHQRAVGHLLYRDTPIFIQSGWLISNAYPLEDTLKSILERDSTRIYFQNFQLQKYIKKENEVTEDIENFISESNTNSNDFQKFIDQNLYNLLNSKFNYNIEYFIRKKYLNLKKKKHLNSFFKKMRNKFK